MLNRKEPWRHVFKLVELDNSLCAVPISFHSLKEGDEFIMHEIENFQPVITDNGPYATVYTATSDPYQRSHPNGLGELIWVIETE